MSVALRNIQIANSVPTIGHEVGRSEPSLDSSAAACRIVVMLFPGFSLLSLSSSLAPFDTANPMCETSKFKGTLARASGGSVATNLGIAIPTTAKFSDLHPGNGTAFAMDLCVLVRGHEAIEAPASVAATVRKCVRQGIPIAALGGAVWLLAELGVLNEGTCTIHWEQMASLAETFETFSVTDAIFEESKGIWTCAGEAASFDLGMALMQTMLGTDLTRDVCKLLLVDGVRTESFRQTGFIP